MSAGAWAAYRSRIAGRTSPTRSRKSPEIKPFCGHRSTYSRQAHCIKDRVLLDIACGSGVFLEEAFAYLQNYCVQYYLSSGEEAHLLEVGNGRYKLPLQEKKPYFKPTKKAEKGLNSYSILETDKRIIFPYDTDGHLIPISEMKSNYPGTYAYLEANYDRLVPKCVSEDGIRDVPNATAETWYQYGRTQALTAFINTPKLIVGVLSKEPMYVLDRNDILIASGGTAGYCAISRKTGSPYALRMATT